MAQSLITRGWIFSAKRIILLHGFGEIWQVQSRSTAPILDLHQNAALIPGDVTVLKGKESEPVRPSASRKPPSNVNKFRRRPSTFRWQIHRIRRSSAKLARKSSALILDLHQNSFFVVFGVVILSNGRESKPVSPSLRLKNLPNTVLNPRGNSRTFYWHSVRTPALRRAQLFACCAVCEAFLSNTWLRSTVELSSKLGRFTKNKGKYFYIIVNLSIMPGSNWQLYCFMKFLLKN